MRKIFDIQGERDGLEVALALAEMVQSTNLKSCFVRVTLERVKYEEEKTSRQKLVRKSQKTGEPSVPLRIAE